MPPVASGRVFCPPTAGEAAAAAAKLPVVVYFHGSGFVLLFAVSRPYDVLCHRICRVVRAMVVSVNYRLAPEHRFPAGYDDGVPALRYYLDVNGLLEEGELARHHGGPLQLLPRHAGGNIVHHVAQRWASTAASPSSSSPPVPLRLTGARPSLAWRSGRSQEEEVELDKASFSLSLARADYFWREFLPEGAIRDHAAA
uniref:Alpha/beta hydrolase fold-3 domain-containing protein n=1 Tax=Oryza punctata TaxID=4537 RepID=A0A0E0JYP0_ORYPU